MHQSGVPAKEAKIWKIEGKKEEDYQEGIQKTGQ